MSELRAATISNLAGTGPVNLTGQSAAKAWANFDGTGTASLRNSFNVSSLTDHGTGDYSTNFTNSFTAANYSASAGNGDRPTVGGVYAVIARWPDSTASAYRAIAYTGVFSTATDSTYGNYTCHGDLA